MASKYLQAAGRRNSPIDMPLAAVAALAVGFVGFVMPGDILARIVEGSGLPDLLPMAAPPLGMKARAAFGLAAAGITFGFVFLLLRALGGSGRPKVRREREASLPFEEEAEPAAPRLRRADAHPDAPARRPILAARELGEPDATSAFRAAPPPPAPEPEPEPVLTEPEIAEAPSFVPDAPAAGEPILDELELTGADIEVAAPPPSAEPVPQPVIEGRPAEPAEPAADLSIADLMARLERGLSRRTRQAPAVAAQAATQPEPEPEPEPALPAMPVFQSAGDDRLRSAIENLQKMAARAG